MRIYFLILILLCCGCQRLSVQIDRLSVASLASTHVNTPDPRRCTPLVGERLLIEWCLPKRTLTDYQELVLHLRVRFANRQEEEIDICLKKQRGAYVYRLADEAYTESGGIATFKVDITGDGQILEAWQHPLWEELITLGE